MISNYLLIAYRNLLNNKLYATVNIIGLSIGLITLMVLYSWVLQEMSYDKHFAHAQNIYRLTTSWDNNPDQAFASTYPMIYTKVLPQFPEIEASARLFNTGLLGNKTRVRVDDKIFTADKVYYADSSLFKVFDISFIQRQSDSPFIHTNGVLLTKQTAFKYFGDDSPVGKVIYLEGQKELIVDGVIADIPSNTHFQFNVLVNMQAHPWVRNAEENLFSGIVFHTYVQLKDGASVRELQQKLNNYLDQLPDDPEKNGAALNMSLQPITEIHLRSNMRFELMANGQLTYVYLFASLGLLAIGVASINYINLALAWYTQRTKEIGVRKVMGAIQKQLVAQFLTESILVTMIALSLAVFAIEVARPVITHLSGSNFMLPITAYQVWVVFGMVAIVIGIATGLFPALAASKINPINLFRPMFMEPESKMNSRKALVIFQLVVSIFLTLCTWAVFKQLRFTENISLGYDKKNLLMIHMGYPEVREKYELMKSRISGLTGVVAVTACSQVPANVLTEETIDTSDGRTEGVFFLSIDKDFFTTLKIPLLQRTPEWPEDLTDKNYFVISKQVAELLGWPLTEVLQQEIKIRHGNMKPGAILGLASDFHFQSLHHPIAPIVFEFTPDMYEYMVIRLDGADNNRQLIAIQNEWEKLTNGLPLDYVFVDDEYTQLYKDDHRLSELLMIFAGIACCIALLGLFAMAAFAMNRKIKSISIRKILGASNRHIISLLTHEFSVAMLIAVMLAAPLGYYTMTNWLQNFAYKTALNFTDFALAVVINLSLAIITIAFHGYKAISINPVEALKQE